MPRVTLEQIQPFKSRYGHLYPVQFQYESYVSRDYIAACAKRSLSVLESDTPIAFCTHIPRMLRLLPHYLLSLVMLLYTLFTLLPIGEGPHEPRPYLSLESVLPILASTALLGVLLTSFRFGFIRNLFFLGMFFDLGHLLDGKTRFIGQYLGSFLGVCITSSLFAFAAKNYQFTVLAPLFSLLIYLFMLLRERIFSAHYQKKYGVPFSYEDITILRRINELCHQRMPLKKRIEDYLSFVRQAEKPRSYESTVFSVITYFELHPQNRHLIDPRDLEEKFNSDGKLPAYLLENQPTKQPR